MTEGQGPAHREFRERAKARDGARDQPDAQFGAGPQDRPDARTRDSRRAARDGQRLDHTAGRGKWRAEHRGGHRHDVAGAAPFVVSTRGRDHGSRGGERPTGHRAARQSGAPVPGQDRGVEAKRTRGAEFRMCPGSGRCEGCRQSRRRAALRSGPRLRARSRVPGGRGHHDRPGRQGSHAGGDRGAVCESQLRRAAGHINRVGALRLRTGRVHRRARAR